MKGLGGFAFMMSLRRSISIVAVLLLLALLTAACQTRQKGRKPSPDWSRSIPVGVLLRGDIDMIVTGAEEPLVHQVWLQEENDRQLVHYLQLDLRAGARVDQNLGLPGDQLRHPRLAATGSSDLHLIWSSRADGTQTWDLQAARLANSGELVGGTRQLAPPEQDVRDFTIAGDGRGGVYVVYASDADGALYGTHLSPSGEVLQEPRLLVRQGETPHLAGEGGAVYLVWYDGGDIRYARWPQGSLSETAGEVVAGVPLGTGQTLDGPVLGIAEDWAYVLWSVYSSSGLEAGTAVARYVAFPKEAPARSNGLTIRTSVLEETPYAPYESAYRIKQLAPPASSRDSAGVIRQPHPAPARASELAVGVALEQESRLDVVIQTGVLLFRDGAYAGYQMAGKTEAFSQEPALTSDESGNLYMAWREGGRGSLAFYALTAPGGTEALDRMTGGDVATTALSGGMEVIAGMLFFPLACIWIFPGLMLIGFLHLRRGESELSQPLTIVVLLVSVLVSQIVKFIFLPTISFYVPFSAWLDIVPAWEDPLRILTPFLTLGIGLLVALLMRRRNPSALAFFFWWIAVDALLTLAIYGVNFLGVF